MREILFRGIYKGCFVFGNLIQGVYNNVPFTEIEKSDSTDFHKWNVLPETVGQYTGLKDKNGVEIFEGDYDSDFEAVMWCDNKNGWALKAFDFPTKEVIYCNCPHCEGNFDIADDEIEIIGNIHEINKK